MTGQEKNTLAYFVDIAGAYLNGGFRTSNLVYDFQDDVENSRVLIIAEEISSEEEELLSKMLAAINLDINNDCKICCDTEINTELENFCAVLCLGQNSAFTAEKFAAKISQTKNLKEIPFMITQHPKEILQNPNLKRPAWENLKLFRLKIS